MVVGTSKSKNPTKREIYSLFIILLALFFSIITTSTGLNSSSFITSTILKILFVVLISIGSVFVIVQTKANIPFYLLILEIFYLVCGLVAIIIYHESSLSFFISVGILLTSILILNSAIISRRFISFRLLISAGIFLIALSFFACLYSNIFEAQTIKNAFIASGENAHFYQISSFFSNKNSYGYILFFAIVSTVLLASNSKKYKWIFVICYLYFFANLIISRCKIAIFCALLAGLFWLINFLIVLFKTRKNTFYIFISVLVFSITVILCLIFIPGIYKNIPILTKLNNYIIEGFFGQIARSFNSRLEFLKGLSGAIANPRILLGYGERTQQIVIAGTAYSLNMDNAYISILLTGGLSKVLLFLGSVFFVFMNILRIRRVSKKHFALLILLFLCSILYYFFEGYSIIGSSFYSLCWVLLLIVYPLVLITSTNNNNSNPFRVLHVVGSFKKGGTESFILNYFEECKKHANIVFDVYCFGDADEEQVGKLRKLGGNIFYGSAPSKKNILKASVSFYKFLAQNNFYSAVHCSANFDNFIYLHITNLLDVNLRIQHAHDTLTGISFNKLEKAIIYCKKLFNNFNSNKSFACSDNAGRDIFCIKKPINFVVIPNSINFDRFRDCDTEHLKKLSKDFSLEDKKIFGNISRFEGKKNQEFVIKIFNQYLEFNKDAILVLGGIDGGTENKIRKTVEELAIDKSVRFIGPRSDVECWLNIIDVYLMPSLFEGFGISAIEAQIAGAYVVASDNLPSSTDLGLKRISYCSLDDLNLWLDEMKKNKRISKINLDKVPFNIQNDYKKLLTEYNFCDWSC